MLFPLMLTAILGSVYGDFACICNYHVERGVYDQPTKANTPVAYLYEFDCKPTVQPPGTLPPDWGAIAYDGKLGYILKDTDVHTETCPGDASPQLMSTSSPMSIVPSSAVLHTGASTSTTQTVLITPSSSNRPATSTMPSIQPTSYTMSTSSIHPTSSIRPSSSVHPNSYPRPSSSIPPTSHIMASSSIHPTAHIMPSSSIYPTSSLNPTPSKQSLNSLPPTVSIHPTSSIMSTSAIHPTSTISTSPSVHPMTTPTTSMSVPTTQPTGITSHAIAGNMDYCPPNLHTYTHQDHGYLAQYGNSCYELVPNRLTWVHAENNCRQKGGHLFHISNSDDELFIYELLIQHFNNHTVWTGLHDRTDEEHFEWTSGDPVTYTHWKPGRQSNFVHHDSEDCVVFVPYIHHGDWDDIPCGSTFLGIETGQQFPFICQFNTSVPVSTGLTTAGPDQQLAPGHTGLCSSSLHYYAQRDGATLGQFDRSCYELIPHHYNWRHAERLCEGRHGFLAKIQNDDEQAFLQAFMMKYNSQHAVWIGLHDLNHEEQFEWTSDGRGILPSYYNWVPGRKDNFESHRTEDCVVMIPYQHGMWDDIPCGSSSLFGHDNGETHYVLCQYETLGVPAPVGK